MLRVCLFVFLIAAAMPVQAADADNEKYAVSERGGADDVNSLPTVKKGLVKEGKYYYYYDSKGKKVKEKWKTIGENRYYFGKNGRAVTGGVPLGKYQYVFVFDEKGRLCRPETIRVITVGKKKYYVNPKGHAAVSKWFIFQNKLYYAGPDASLYLEGKTLEGVTFTKDGYAKSDAASEVKMLAMNIMSRITNSGMTRDQKLRAAWNYVISSMRYYGKYPSGKAGWQKELAYTALKYGLGNCYGYACAFAALAREAGYDPYLYCARVAGSRDGAADGYTRHCWVTIGGLHFDPEAQALGWCRGIYGLRYFPCSYKFQYAVRYAG